MGGRGASSSGGDGLPAKFRDVLGRKGAPRDVATALKTANPKFNDDEVYRLNCQRCIWAYEMQRRGYKVEARSGVLNDEFNLQSTTGGFMHVFDDAKWENVKWYKGDGDMILNMPKSRGGTVKQRYQIEKNIEKKMTDWGEGSRAAITIEWRRAKCGHTFNAENIGGKTYVVDAQTGKKLPLWDYIKDGNVLGVKICRTDNLSKPNYKALKKAVKPI